MRAAARQDEVAVVTTLLLAAVVLVVGGLLLHRTAGVPTPTGQVEAAGAVVDADPCAGLTAGSEPTAACSARVLADALDALACQPGGVVLAVGLTPDDAARLHAAARRACGG